jgi:general secretion pathway protein F
MRRQVAVVADDVGQGTPFHEAINRFPDLFRDMDQQTIAVSEKSGALDSGLLSLSHYHDTRAKARDKIVSASMFPVALLVAAVFIGHLPQLVLGAMGQSQYSVVNYLFDTGGFLALLIGLVVLGDYLLRRLLRIPGVNVTVDRFLRAIPVVGRVRFDYALSQWISSIRLMLNAGFAMFQALEYASNTTPSPLIAHAFAQARPLIHSQTDVSDALHATGVFPDEVIQLWATGEKSGRLDDMLERLAGQAEERWRRSLEQLAAWLPKIVYGLVCIYIVVQIFNLLAPIIGIYKDLLNN